MGKLRHRMHGAVMMAAVMSLLAGCTTPSAPYSKDDKSAKAPPSEPARGAPGPVVTGNCPQVSLRDGTSFLRRYAKGAKDDPAKLLYQASLAETTRQCTVNESAMTITVMAQGRLVLGPMGQPGTFTLPVRVAVIEGENTVYSQLVKFNAELAPGQASGQFLFSKNDVVIPGGISGTARIFLGFDEGPYNTK